MLTLLTAAALADPCGMVPPAWIPEGPVAAIERQGVQQTYVFHQDGVQTIAIRPGFRGSAHEFGMLVPLPAAPALRKIADETFAHLEAAVDPPEVKVHIYEEQWLDVASVADGGTMKSAARESNEGYGGLRYNEVKVVSEEAIGMYEVAVLQAGSDYALSKWMQEHDYRYPDGMDAVVLDYVKQGWVFVAVKARVGQMPGVEPHPGMRDTTPELPEGATFDGYVQGMAFRFEVETPVVPMRLSTFNGDDLHNRVYFLYREPSKIEKIDASLVVRQVPGPELHKNVTGLLPVIYDGNPELIPEEYVREIELQRNPEPYNGVARDLFASDLLAARRGELSLPFEKSEKELLNISESLNLRGAAIDALHAEQIAAQRAEATAGILPRLKGLHLTVVDGDFPRDLLRDENLTFEAYEMPARRNSTASWTQQPRGPEIWVPVYGGGGRWNPFWR